MCRPVTLRATWQDCQTLGVDLIANEQPGRHVFALCMDDECFVGFVPTTTGSNNLDQNVRFILEIGHLLYLPLDNQPSRIS